MKNKILSCIFGFSLSIISACSSNSGTANAKSGTTNTESKTVIAESKFNLENLDKIEYIADTKNSYIGRYIDCKAGVTIYTHHSGVAVIPNSQISKKLINEKCK